MQESKAIYCTLPRSISAIICTIHQISIDCSELYHIRRINDYYVYYFKVNPPTGRAGPPSGLTPLTSIVRLSAFDEGEDCEVQEAHNKQQYVF